MPETENNFVPIIHTDSVDSKIFEYVRKMVVDYNEYTGDMTSEGVTDDAQEERLYYITAPYSDSHTSTRGNYENKGVYIQHLQKTPNPTHVIVITGNSVRMTAVEGPMFP